MLTIYQIDAFTRAPFRGNPAAVVPLDNWPEDALLQNIAAENNLAETAFFVPVNKNNNAFELRWFTPSTEVPLCGHATLASAHVLCTHMQQTLDDVTEAIHFHTRQSGTLTVQPHAGGSLEMDFPSLPPVPTDEPRFADALRQQPTAILAADVGGKIIYLVRLENQRQIETLEPDMQLLRQIDCFGTIVTAPGDSVDFVSRFFAPCVGIDEDPVTGGAHSVLTPYWASQLKKTRMDAQQLSQRGGELTCELRGERVAIIGHAVDYMQGTILIDGL